MPSRTGRDQSPITSVRAVTPPRLPVSRSIHSRVVGHPRQQRVAAALAAQDRRPELLGGVGEDLVGRGALDDPRLLLELGLELSRAPARVAGEDADAAEVHVELLEVRVGGQEPDRALDDQPGLPGIAELGQDDDRRRLDRAAGEDRRVRAGDVGQPRDRAADRHLRRPVEHEAHRALVVVRGDEDDGAAEVRVLEARAGDEELSAQGIHDAPDMIADAVVPVAGRGTRLLPATKSQPKEMLPVGAKPVVQYVVEELRAAGLSRILFVTGANKRAIEDHFDDDGVFFTRQPVPLGLGDAVRHGAAFTADRPFVVALGDSIVDPASPLPAMLEAFEAHDAACVVCVEEVPPDRTDRYGIVAPAEPDPGAVFAVRDIVEKPAAGTAPSALAVAGRYVLAPEVHAALASTGTGTGGELQLTDAIRALDGPLIAVRLPPGSRRHDIGTPESYARAFLHHALRDPVLREEARALLDGHG